MYSRRNRDEGDYSEIIVFKPIFILERVYMYIYMFRDAMENKSRSCNAVNGVRVDRRRRKIRRRRGRKRGEDREKRARRDTSGGKRRAGANLACQEVAYSSRTKASRGTRARLGSKARDGARSSPDREDASHGRRLKVARRRQGGASLTVK